MFPHLRAIMGQRRVRVLDLALLLKLSDGQVSLRLAGRLPFLPHERTRICEFFSLCEDWLFAPLNIPHSARLETMVSRQPVEMR
jgi:hypothetical protein